MKYLALAAWTIVLIVLMPMSCYIGRHMEPVSPAPAPQCWEEMRQCRKDTDICRTVLEYPVSCEEYDDDQALSDLQADIP